MQTGDCPHLPCGAAAQKPEIDMGIIFGQDVYETINYKTESICKQMLASASETIYIYSYEYHS